MGASTPDSAVERLLKTWHLQKKPGVLTASLFMLCAVEAVLGLWWPGLRVFAAAQVSLMLIVVLSVALVDAGKAWDDRLFDDLYRPSGVFDDTGRELPPGRFLWRERPWAGLYPSGPDLARAREQASAAIGHPMQGLYKVSHDYLASPDRSGCLAEIDGPLELSKGLRALLAPLVVMVVVGVAAAGGGYATDSESWTAWAAVAGGALSLWAMFAYVYVQQRHEHMVRLYKEVAGAARPPA